ncbi:MAG: hypothetical protein NWF00_01405 [Candidatus Bathyarchaeota archaeon]|nr:hypothetical protein [Candidatus Bathyarchaeota archaeon]
MEYWKETRELKKVESTNPKQKSLLELFLYLQLVEGNYSEIVTALTFILVKNGHDLYTDIPRPRYIKEQEEVRNVSLFLRELFLKEHGFSSFTRVVDRDVRNCIAHLNYEVKEDGRIFDRKTGLVISDLISKSDSLG